MMKRILLLPFLCLLLSFSQSCFSQKKEDVLYLRDSSIIRGRIADTLPGKIRIRTQDGSLMAVNAADILRQELAPAWGSYIYKKRGFAHFTELGPLVAGKTTIDGVTTAAFSFQMVNGYKWNRLLFTGFGIGADLYATQTIIPLLASIRGDFRKEGTVIPYYFVDAGYGWNITQDAPATTNFTGGFTWASGIGLKIPFNRNAGFLLSLGYRFQETSYLENNLRKEVDYKRLALRAGFFL